MTIYNNPYYDIPQTSIVWALGLDPVINWTAPAVTPDHFRVWKAATPDFTAAVDISSSLTGATHTYSDTTAVVDGTPQYYWVIGYDAGETLSGYNNGVQGCQNAVSYSGEIAEEGPTPGNLPFDFTLDIPPFPYNGTYLGDITVTLETFTPGFPFDSGGELSIAAAIQQTDSNTATQFPVDLNGPSIINFNPAPSTGSNSSASFDHNVNDFPIVSWVWGVAGDGPGSQWGVPGDPPFGAADGSGSAAARLSYTSDHSTYASGGSGGPGGSDLSPPSDSSGAWFLMWPS